MWGKVKIGTFLLAVVAIVVFLLYREFWYGPAKARRDLTIEQLNEQTSRVTYLNTNSKDTKKLILERRIKRIELEIAELKKQILDAEAASLEAKHTITLIKRINQLEDEETGGGADGTKPKEQREGSSQ